MLLNPGDLTATFDRLVIQLAPALVLLLGLAMISDRDVLEVAPAKRVELVGQ